MTPNEALAVLELVPDDLRTDKPADRVRRAYLRKVREHPPERDPDGFQRVRAAFDLLRDGVFGVPEPAPPEPIRERLFVLDDDDDDVAEEEDDDDGPAWVSEPRPVPRVRAVPVPVAEVSGSAQLAEAQTRIACGEYAAGAEQVVSALARAYERPFDVSARLPASEVLTVILTLLAERALPEARRVGEAGARWLETQRLLAVLGEDSERWCLAQELLALVEFPDHLRARLARALLDRERDCVSLVFHEAEEVVYFHLEQMRRVAPLLARSVPKPANSIELNQPWVVQGLLTLALVWLVIRLVMWVSSW